MHWFVTIAAALLAACAGSSGEPLLGGASPECNDGDGRDAPTELIEALPMSGAKVEGCLFERDADTFFVEASPESGGTVYGIALKPSAAMKGKITLFDASHARIVEALDNSPGATLYTWLHLAPGSRAYLRVTQVDQGDSAPYTLAVAETTINEPSEPNDDKGSATPLVLGEALFAHLSAATNRPKMATDTYSFAVEKEQDFAISVDGLRKLEAVLTLHGPEGELASSRSKPDGGPLALERKLGPGAYTLSLRPATRMPGAGRGTVPGRFVDGYSISVTAK